MSHPFDATLKPLVADHPSDFAILGLPQGEPATPLNVDLSTISAATDVALGFGKPVREIVDLNFQTGPDAGLPARCSFTTPRSMRATRHPYGRPWCSCAQKRMRQT